MRHVLFVHKKLLPPLYSYESWFMNIVALKVRFDNVVNLMWNNTMLKNSSTNNAKQIFLKQKTQNLNKKI